MLEQHRDVFYYITVMNESYEQPSLRPEHHADVIKGMYSFARRHPENAKGRVHLLGSGAIFREVIAAAELLEKDWQIASDVWSVTSFSELAREAREIERHNRLQPTEAPHVSHVSKCLAGPMPVIAATDYVAAYPQLIAAYVDNRFVALGTDGFGRSDTRQALRSFFEVDRHQIVVAALDSLRDQVPRSIVAEAINRYGIQADALPPWQR
jgi:pyruvate dehydrogenase E1 component